MEMKKILLLPLIFQVFLFAVPIIHAAPGNSKLFREYLGAEGKSVKFSDVPINSEVEFHFILSFAIDYSTSLIPTNGDFNVYWDKQNLGPSAVASIKARKPNVKVAMSLGGDTIGSKNRSKQVHFSPKSINSWVSNAVASLTRISMEYDLDGIDIDYEHFSSDPETFAECVGQLITHLKQNKVVSFTSIAPYENKHVKPYYLALWKKYGHLIDYVNFQFYAYPKGTTVSQFMKYFEDQSSNYRDGKVLVSFGTDGSGGLSPANGFFEACGQLKRLGKLHGIFVWSADDSVNAGFRFERKSENILATIQ